MRIGRGDYRRVKLIVMAEIEQIKQILSEVPPLIQTMICPRLAFNFARNIMIHFFRMDTDLSLTNFVAERHDELCVAMFRSVLTCNLLEYEPEIFWRFSTQNLVIQTLDSVPGLRTLCLQRVSHTNTSAQVATSIHHLKDLQVFAYDRYCTDEVVMQLGLNCPELTEVSFSGSNGVTNDSVPHLLLLSKLQFLNLRGTQIDSTHYGLLLSQLPNIADIRFANERVDVLNHITPETLDTITHVYGIVNDIYLQIEKFPKTTNFVVNKPSLNLSGITAWAELRTVQILMGNYLTFNMNAVLTGIGHKLTELKLAWVSNVNLQDIITLGKSMKSLTLIMCTILPLNAVTPLDPQLPHFRNLTSLHIEKIDIDQTDFSYIKYYVNLEKIALSAILIFTVDFMREVVRRGTLANLQECRLFESRMGALTFEVLKLLIRHCSHLRVFGCTEYLPRLNPFNIVELKRQMSAQNFDLDIISSD
jgi:hypothetical protein